MGVSYLANGVQDLQSESKEPNMEARELKRNVAPMTIAALLLVAANLTKVALLRTKPFV